MELLLRGPAPLGSRPNPSVSGRKGLALVQSSPLTRCVQWVAPRHTVCAPARLRRLHATDDALAELGLTSEQRTTVGEVIAATAAASDLQQSVQVLVSYSGSASAARALVLKHPTLLCCQLQSWVEFLTAFGLCKAQVQHVLCQTPEALAQGNLVKAGESILTFRRLGMTDVAAAQLVTYYPQLLGKGEEDIRTTVSLLGRFQQGVESSSC